MRHSAPLFLFSLLCLLVIPACGGDSESSPPAGSAPPPRAMASIQGMVVKDPVKDCDLLVRGIIRGTGNVDKTLDLGSGRSGQGGSFGLDFAVHDSGMHEISATGGTFTNRATGQPNTLGTAMRCIFGATPDQAVAGNVTFMTTVIAYRFDQLRVLRALAPAKYVLRMSKADMRAAFGINQVYACPLADGTDDEKKLWLMDIGLQEMARTVSEPVTEVIEMFAKDLMDGRPDGFVCGVRGTYGSGAPIVIDPMTKLSLAIIAWLSDPLRNDSSILPGDPIVLALQGKINQLIVRGVLEAAPRILSFSKRFVSEVGGDMIYANLAPYANPTDILLRALEHDGRAIAMSAPTLVTTNGVGVHQLEFTTPAASKGLHDVMVVDAVTGLFDIEPLQFCDPPGLTTLDGIQPPRGLLVGGGMTKIQGKGFDANDPPDVKIGGRTADIVDVLSPECVRVWVPRGITTGLVAVEVDGTVRPGFFEYLAELPIQAPSPARHLIALLGEGAGGGGGGGAILDGSLDFGTRSYDLAYHRAGDPGPLGEGIAGNFDSVGSGGDDEGITLDSVGTLSLSVTGDGIDDISVVTVTQNPDDPTSPPGLLGSGVLIEKSTVAPPITGTFDVTGTCIEAGVKTQIRGTATFRLDGSVFVSGLTSKRADGGGESVSPLFAFGRWSVSASGRLSFTDFPGGFTMTGGAVTPSGGFGAVILKSPGKLVHLYFSRRNVTPHPLDGFGPDLTSIHSRLGAAFEEIRSARSTMMIREGQSLVIGGLKIHERDTTTGIQRIDEIMREQIDYVSFHGRRSSADGKSNGVIGAAGTSLEWDPLPQDGLSAAGSLAGSGLGYGCTQASDAKVSVRSWVADYKVLAMGIELEPDATPTPNPEHRSIMELGCLVRETDDLDVGGFTLATGAKLRWDRIKRKTVDRDAGLTVVTTVDGASSESGFAMIVTGGEFYAYACPLPPEGTKCFFRGCFTADGSFGTARSSDGFGAPWHAVLVRKSASAPVVDGAYNARYLCHTFSGGTTYAINGDGTYTFDSGAGTYAQDTSQVATAETGAVIPSGPDVYPGTFTVKADGCIDMTTDFGGGFTSDLCGAVTENGSVIVTMDPEVADINCFTLYTLRDEAAGALALVPAREKYCGLHLDFDGSGGITAATRYGKLVLAPGVLARTLGTTTWSNITPGVTTASETLTGRPLTIFPDRTFTADLALGRVLTGARSSVSPVIGSQNESGVAAPAGSFGVSIRGRK